MNCREPSNSGRNESDRVNLERVRLISDDVRSGILIEMCLENVTTHVPLSLTRLQHYDAVRSEVEMFLEARQSSSVDRKVCVSHLWTARPLGCRVFQAWHGWSGSGKEQGK